MSSIVIQTANLDFTQGEFIGQEGRNSTVFEAIDNQTNRDIVIKRIEKSKVSKVDSYFAEARMLYAATHPYVAELLYACYDDNFVYLSMPNYRNGSMESLINTRFLTVREVIRYGLQFLAGLHRIHSKGLLHLDIKPTNLLLSDSNEALITDFGLSKYIDNNGIAQQGLAYTKQWPPEVLSTVDRSFQFDIYQAGITLYRMLCGNESYNRQFVSVVHNEYKDSLLEKRFPDRTAYPLHVPIKLQRVVNRAIEVNPLDRYPSVLKMMNELGGIEENLDWLYSANGSSISWTKQLVNKSLCVTLEDVDGKFSINSTKTMNVSNRTTNIRDHCYSGLTASNHRSKVKKALKEL